MIVLKTKPKPSVSLQKKNSDAVCVFEAKTVKQRFIVISVTDASVQTMCVVKKMSNFAEIV